MSEGFKLCQRLANECLFKVKVGQSCSDSRLAAQRKLSLLLEELSERLAVRRFGEASLETALHAAAMVQDGVHRCRVYFISGQILWLYLLNAQRHVFQAQHGIARDSLLDDETGARPVWLLAFESLIDLSRRSWTYLRLAAARCPAWGFKGRLCALYLGPGREPALATDIGLRKDVEEEIVLACANLGESAGTADPIEATFWRLNQLQLAAKASRPWHNRSVAVDAVLQALVEGRPKSGYGSARYRALSRALDQMVIRLGYLGQVVGRGAQELLAEIEHPGSVLPDTPNLLEILNAVPEDHSRIDTKPPAHVLHDLSRWDVPPSTAHGPPDSLGERVTAHEELVAALYSVLAKGTPERRMVGELLLCNSLDGIRLRMTEWFPLPADVIGIRDDWRVRAAQRLQQWQGFIAAVDSGREEPMGALELPDVAWEDPHLLEEAGAWFRAPPGEVGQCYETWDDVPASLRQAISHVITTVMMEDLAEALGAVYRVRRGRFAVAKPDGRG